MSASALQEMQEQEARLDESGFESDFDSDEDDDHSSDGSTYMYCWREFTVDDKGNLLEIIDSDNNNCKNPKKQTEESGQNALKTGDERKDAQSETKDGKTGDIEAMDQDVASAPQPQKRKADDNHSVDVFLEATGPKVPKHR